MTKLESPQVKTHPQMAILAIFHWRNPISKLGQEFNKSNYYMKFGRNWAINDFVRVSKSANLQAAAILATILVIVHQT